MRKLNLQLNELKVESFLTDSVADGRGTVLGRDDATAHCDTSITLVCGTCYVSCNYSACPADCGDTYDCPIDSSVYTDCNNCYPTYNEAYTCQVC